MVRLYAAVLNARLMDFLEEGRLRAPTQAGFSPQLSINHHLFALQHMIDRRIHRPRGQKKPLYCCFVDLTAAYDCVQRPLMWEALRRYGIRGRMLAAFQSLYADTHIAMKVAGRIGISLPYLIGARQGCPGSPTLSGCTVDGLPAYLDAHAPDAGILIQVGDRDVLLVSHLIRRRHRAARRFPADLQLLLDALSGFCAALGLDVSLAKTQIVCFGLPPDTPRPAFTYAGRTLPHADRYKHLGTTFTPAGAAGDGLPQLRSSVGNAFHSVRFKFDRLGCASNIHLQLHLYDASVTGTALSSCEVWGVHPAAQQQRRKLAAQHRGYVCSICRLPRRR